jgi:type I restriction enzyme R subunit
MGSVPRLHSNFAQLKEHDEQFVRSGMLAERYFAEDPNTCLIKLRQLAEVLAQAAASQVGIFLKPEEGQYELLGRLRDNRILPPEIYQLFGEIRRTGNAANHAMAGDHRTALSILKIAWQVGVWFHRTFRDPKYRSGAFIPPQPPKNESVELKLELEELAKALDQQKTGAQEQAQQLEALSAQLAAAKDEQTFWEQMAAEVEAEKADLNQKLAAWQQHAVNQPVAKVAAVVGKATKAAGQITLDEKATRQLIDSQLREAGWLVDSQELRHAKGTRPKKGANMAIAEWPTETGPADYVLFAGLTPLAAVEAKRKNLNVSSNLQQSKRYSRGFQPSAETMMHPANWGKDGEFRLPFVYSSNGRSYSRQLATNSGIWFADIRRPTNISHPLQGWRSPEGLSALLAMDVDAAQAGLEKEGFLRFCHPRLSDCRDHRHGESHRRTTPGIASRHGHRHRQNQDLHVQLHGNQKYIDK